MSKFDEMIATMKAASYAEKRQFLQYLAQMAERAKHQIAPEDQQALLSYAYEEVENMRSAIAQTERYSEKDLIFTCEDFLLGMVIHLTGSVDKLPPDQLLKIQALVELVNKERYIETNLDSIFSASAITHTDMNRLLYWVRSTTDEYQKSMLWQGLLHYQARLADIDTAAKQLLTDYVVSELQRLPALGNEDAWNALELLADLSKYFNTPDVITALQALLLLERNHIRYYAVASLCKLGADIPLSVIHALAEDLEYAALTYHALQQSGKAALFPAEYATEEYLAKSDLVRWLTYPTELGKAPDEIEYLGKAKQLFKKEVFHVFKYHSDSDTLDEALKGKWLIGWSSNEGGTFSNFDEFAPYEGLAPEKAVKQIKKQIIG